MKKMTAKQYGLWLALALTLVATAWASFTEENGQDVSNGSGNAVLSSPRKSVAASTSRARKPSRAGGDQSSAPAELDIQHLKRPRVDVTASDLFSVDMPVTHAAEEQAAAPAVVEAPPLPYSYAGKLEEDGNYIVFLTNENKNYAVRMGDTLGSWYVKSIRPPNMIMRYLPLKIDVPLIMGEVN